MTEDNKTASETSSFTKLLAKPDETLEEHTLKAIEWLTKYLEWRGPRLRRIAIASGIGVKELKSRLFATCYLHDIGKASRAFQAYDFGKGSHGKGIPHPLLSLPFIYAAIPKPIEVVTSRFYFEVITVMSHHTPFYDNLYRAGYRDLIIQADQYHIEEALRFYHQLPEIHRQFFGFEYPFEIGEPPFGEKVNTILDRAGDFYRVPRQTRLIHSFYVSALKYADWLASGHDPTYRYGIEDIAKGLHVYLEQEYPHHFRGLFQFQKEAHRRKGNVIIKAPTGQGKTEAALLWANSNSSNGRVAYLLPARVSSNAMYERLKRVFNQGVGISHGTSALIIADNEAWDERVYKGLILRASAFMEPITVATVDQLLLSLFNWRHWELIEEATSDSALIFDEIHAYDPYTTSLIVKASRNLARRGANLAFMTATLPNYLMDFLKEKLNITFIVADKEHLDLKRHLVCYTPAPIQAAINGILKAYRNGKHVLVVLNTVEEAIDLYQSLKANIETKNPKQTILYHSRFIETHRREKEALIKQGAHAKGGFIAVTTQVAEVSLDIDYDVLYTQLAPVDALIQRMGRVNRKGKKKVEKRANAFVFGPGPHDGFVYGSENIERAMRIVPERMTGTRLSEREFPALVERQYPANEELPKLTSELRNLDIILGEIRQNLWQIQTIQLQDRENVLRKLAKTRKDRFPTIEAIPLSYKESVIDKLPPGRRLEKIRYYVRLPLYKFGDSLRSLEDGLYASIRYDEELGATEPMEPESVF